MMVLDDQVLHHRAFCCVDLFIFIAAFHFFFRFQRYFDRVDICKVRKGWNEVRLQGYLPPNSVHSDHLTCCIITVPESTEVEFTLFQGGQRYNKRFLSSTCILFEESVDTFLSDHG
jgi:hypothetical protein